MFNYHDKQTVLVDYLDNGEVDILFPIIEKKDKQVQEFIAALFFYLYDKGYSNSFTYDVEKKFLGFQYRHVLKFVNQGAFFVFLRDELGLSEDDLRGISEGHIFFSYPLFLSQLH